MTQHARRFASQSPFGFCQNPGADQKLYDACLAQLKEQPGCTPAENTPANRTLQSRKTLDLRILFGEDTLPLITQGLQHRFQTLALL